MKLSRKIFSLYAATLMLTGTIAAQPTVHYISLKDGEATTSNPIKEFAQPETPKKAGVKITIFPDVKLQTIEGVGGIFSEIGADAFMSLNKKGQEEVINALFNPAQSAFSICRTPIGASDFASSAYSYADKAEDYEMSSFSIDRDKKSLIPMVKMAQTTNPALTLVASPWSPPAWMKANETMEEGGKSAKRNNLKNTAQMYSAYALYFTKYIESYKAEGVEISRVILQDDNDLSAKFPSNLMMPDQMAKVATAVRNQFKESGIEAQIWGGSFKSTTGLGMLRFAANKKSIASVDGVAFHYTDEQYIADLKFLAPKKPIMASKGQPMNGANTTQQAGARFVEIVTYLNAGVPSYCYSNMISTETQSGAWENKQNSLITIEKGKVTYNPDFAVMSIFGQFLKSGSVRVASNAKGIKTVTVKDGDTFYVFVRNDKENDVAYQCADVINGNVNALVPAKSIAVISYPAKAKK